MIAFFLTPIGRYVAAAIAACVLIIGAVWYIEGRGGERAVAKIDAANKASESKADKAERGVLNCPAGKWNREARACEP